MPRKMEDLFTISRLITIFKYEKNRLLDREAINRIRNKKKEGLWVDFYDNEKVKIERTYVDDKLHGYYKEFDEIGKITKLIRYENGQKIREEDIKEIKIEIKEEFYENGIVKKKGGYKKGRPVGIHTNYDENGEILNSTVFDEFGDKKSEGKFNKNGLKNGEWKNFYSSGKIKGNGSYKNGKKTGMWCFYYKNGNIEEKGLYQNDKTNGVWKWFYQSGNILREENFLRGKEHGAFVEYSKDFMIIVKGNYLNGEKDGFWFYNVGDQIEEGNYFSNKKDGIWKYYFTNRTLKFEGNFIRGRAEGKHIYYFSNGKTKEIKFFENGIKEKKWSFYDSNGILIKTITYKNNKEIKINGLKLN